MNEWHRIDDQRNPPPLHQIVLVAYEPDGKVHIEPKYGLMKWTQWGDHTIRWDESNWTWTMKPTHWSAFYPLNLSPKPHS